MTFKKGDKVKFLNDVGGGIITRIDNKLIYVCNEDGFDIPVTASQLLKVESFDSQIITETPGPEKPAADPSSPAPVTGFNDFIDLEQSEESNIDPTINILLSWVANRKKNGKTTYDLYLINDCGYNVMYVTAMVIEGAYRGIQAGMLENETTIHLTEITEQDLKEISKIRVECLFFKKGAFMPQEPMQYELRIDESYISDITRYTPNDYFDDKALLINVTEEYLMAEIENVSYELQNKFEKQKKHADKPADKPQKKPDSDNKEEVDLHIEHLVENTDELSPAEILDIQMARFNIALEGALKNHQKRIVFIHGVGNGRLRLEIRRTLDQKFPRLRYQDASFKEYGYGATLVFTR